MDDAKQLINRFVEELWNERRLDVADAIFAKDCVTHQLRSGVPADAVPRGPQAIKEHVAGWVASFPDLRFSIEQMVSEGDRVFGLGQALVKATFRGKSACIDVTHDAAVTSAHADCHGLVPSGMTVLPGEPEDAPSSFRE
jgi:ketosteroid isomerase-like protein